MKPMLAATVENIKFLNYPLIASPKLDGIRALNVDGSLVSRSLKPISNIATRMRFSRPEFEGYDGELILGEHDSTVFRRTTSAVARRDGDAGVSYWVFDLHGLSAPFTERYERLEYESRKWGAHMKLVPVRHIKDTTQLEHYEQECLDAGYEGVMLRTPQGGYKYGRSTLREGWLMKLKQFADDEAEIIGFEERMHNANTATTNALGHTERSSHAENMVGRGDLGALVVRGLSGPYAGVRFNIGTGFDDTDRDTFWRGREHLLGQAVKYKYFPQGSKDAPRFPVFLGMRPAGL
jgi:DNA ligase-1